MKRKNVTRNALITSMLSMLLCVSMLVGTTFAWFTDEVVSGTNVIAAGNLDVELYNDVQINNDKKVDTNTKLFEDITYWEPGVVAYENLTVANVGSLALNYQLGINFSDATETEEGSGKTLADVLKVGFVEGGIGAGTDREDALEMVTEWKPLESFVKADYLLGKTAASTDSDTYGLVIYWEPSNIDNDYNMNNGKTNVLSIKLGIKLMASQKSQEEDSFGPDYDVLAQGATTSVPAPANGEEIILTAPNGKGQDVNVASFSIPNERIADPKEDVKIEIIPSTLYENITITDEQQASTYEITVSNINDADPVNPVLIHVELQIGAGRTGVKVYHMTDEITNATYDPNSGWVKFDTTSFSPYTVVYDDAPAAPAEPEEDYDGPANLPEGLPTATVTDVSAEKANKTLEWKPFGDFIGVADSAQQLAKVYKYEAADEDYDAKYDQWYCDFYVSVSQSIGAGQLFLGGEYGNYGWVGFDAPAVDANVEYALLASATAGQLVTHGGVSNTSWRYSDIKNFVGTFHCGVAESIHNTDADLSGMTFTVKLCLTNPADPSQYYDVHTIEYTFPQE